VSLLTADGLLKCTDGQVRVVAFRKTDKIKNVSVTQICLPSSCFLVGPIRVDRCKRASFLSCILTSMTVRFLCFRIEN
jgi:hypothetical protein